MAIIDSSFWFDNSLVHELLHMYIYDNRIKHDSAYYFFNESFVEYLSVYFTYEDSTMRDSVFQAKHSKYETSKHTHSSVFELKDNMLSEGSNSSDLIYLETPYKIHQFGKNIGEKRFIKIIRKMYKRKVNISTMKKYLYRAGVGKTQIRTFLSGL